MTGDDGQLYDALAEWWYLLSPPEDYEEEAGLFVAAMLEHARGPVRTVLELGCGGGNNASWMKRRFTLTLTDRAARMVALSRGLNPECEHHVGDMRTLRLGRTFDGVFVHDAIDYMATRDDLRAAITTAATHCRTGGVVLLAPDDTAETFAPSTECGGNDGPDGRGMRYLEWSPAHAPGTETHHTDYAFLLRERNGAVRVVHERHVHGLFPQAVWLDTMRAAGLAPAMIPFAHSQVEPGRHHLFIGVKT